MDRQQFIIDKFGVDLSKKLPYHIDMCRWREFPLLLKELGVKVGAEIGVEQGLFSAGLLRRIPDLKLYCVDCWDCYEGYREGYDRKAERYYERAIEKLTPFGDRAVIVKKYSMDAVKDFEDESLDFIYIDANHDFQSATNDIAEWSKKVKIGGIVSGHDFKRAVLQHERIDVKDVVQAWAYSHSIRPWYVLDRGDRSPSWMWVKQCP